MEALSVRFSKKVKRGLGCWAWVGHIDAEGYGRFFTGKRNALAHRVSYELSVGPIPNGLQIDHLCKNKACVNPQHLEAVTAKTNVLRSNAFSAINAAKTHCIHGHPFDATNTYSAPQKFRVCRTCQRAAVRRYKKRKTK